MRTEGATPQLVIDTNVWISAFRSARGASRRVVEGIFRGAYDLHVSVPLLFEYEEILKRERKALDLTLEEVEQVILLITGAGIFHEIHYLWRGHTRDPDDAHVLEAAVAAPCEYLLTFNTKDLQGARRFGIRLMTPGEFLREMKEQR